MSGIVGNNTNRSSGLVKSAVVGADAIDGSNIADDAIDSEHYVDVSIDAAHIASNAVTTAKINADAVTGAEIADDALDSEHYTDGSIDTAHIADNQITLAKMAGGTDGQILTYDASGDPVAVGPGTDGQVLTSTGAGSPPAFEDAAGGGLGEVIVGPTTFTGVRNVDIGAASGTNAWAAGYNYRVHVYNLQHTSSGSSEGDSRMVGLQLLTNGSMQGSSYTYRIFYTSLGTDITTAGQNSIRLTSSTLLGSSTTIYTALTIDFVNPAQAGSSLRRSVTWIGCFNRYSDNTPNGTMGVGFHPSTLAYPITGCSIVHLAANTALETSTTFSGTYIVTRSSVTA